MNNVVPFQAMPMQSDYSNVPQRMAPVVPVNCSEATNITSFEDLKAYANGTVVRFSDFGEGQPFVARVRRPSMLALAKSGKIPNSLLSVANDLFAKGGSAIADANEDFMSNMYDVCHVLCEAALIEPTLQQIEEAGLELSDKHVMEIFNYTQAGIKALEDFRK